MRMTHRPHVMAGAGVGGLIGFFLGSLKGSRREEMIYSGPERRYNRSPYHGVERRASPH